MKRNDKRKIHKKKKTFKRSLVLIMIVGICIFAAKNFISITVEQEDIPVWVDQQLIVSNTTSEDKNIRRVNDIVIHYVANPGSTAMANRNYFASTGSNVNAHFVVGLRGEIIQCMPLYLKSAASNNRNGDTISIEVCHPDQTGKFNETTLNSVVKLTAWLCDEFKINRDNVIRHGDITGKNCPKYFMENEYAWQDFKEKVKKY